MSIKPSKIDTRAFQELLDKARAMAKLYTPEWDAASDTGIDVALLKIFIHILETIIYRKTRYWTKITLRFWT